MTGKNDVTRPTTAVLIVGGGPVGLTAALLLDQFGIDCVVAERKGTTSQRPKCRGLGPRSMEQMRQLGLDRKLAARGFPPYSDFTAVATMVTAAELGRTLPEPDRGQGPAWKCMVTQDIIEDELHRAADLSEHVTLCFSTEVAGITQEPDYVTVRLQSTTTGEPREWTASYVIAADGVASGTRTGAGIEMTGPTTIFVGVSEFWQSADDRLRTADGAWTHFVVPPQADPVLPAISVVARECEGNGWMSQFTVGYEEKRPWDDRQVVEIIRRQTGLPDLAVELRGHSVFRVSNQVARSYRDGRVFLAGDAAHSIPYTGGMGLSTGIQDVHNLVWKLAFVLRGVARERLLDTYEVERRPVAVSNGNWSVGNAPRFAAPGRASGIPELAAAVRSGNRDHLAFCLRDFEHHMHNAGRSLGYSYEAGAVLPDGSAPPAFDSRYYTPTDRPGHRFPHLWTDLTYQRSTLDWFGTAFTLVAGPAGDEWLEAGHRVREKLEIPLSLRTLPSAGQDSGIELGLRGAALVRPDGHVAWRTPWLPASPDDDLAAALQTLLA